MGTENNNKTRYSDKELQEFKIIIDDKIIQGKEQLAFFETQLKELQMSDDIKLKGMDNGIGSAEKDRLINMIERQKKHLQYLNNALSRIENKVYGICRETGKLISKERLKAVPHATLSIQAKENRRKDK